jgi:hypothetical protein
MRFTSVSADNRQAQSSNYSVPQNPANFKIHTACAENFSVTVFDTSTPDSVTTTRATSGPNRSSSNLSQPICTQMAAIRSVSRTVRQVQPFPFLPLCLSRQVHTHCTEKSLSPASKKMLPLILQFLEDLFSEYEI